MHMTNMTAEQALRRFSDEAWEDASRLQGPSAASGAFQAGYFALFSALSATERHQFQEHPSPRAALLGALKLQLDTADIRVATRMARHYYAPIRAEQLDAAALLVWAGRVRNAAGWAGDGANC